MVQGALTAAGSGEEVVPVSIIEPCRARCASSRLLGKKTLEAEILKRAFEHATGSKKTAAAAAVAAEGRLSPQPLSSGDWSLAVGELLPYLDQAAGLFPGSRTAPILGPGCWPFPGSCGQRGPCAADRPISSTGALLPIALCETRRSSAIVFLGTDPGALWFAAERPLALIHLIRTPEVAWALAGSIVFLVIMQFLYRGLQSLGHERRRIPTLMVSITTQIGLLAIFKYYNFFINSLSSALQGIGIPTASLHLSIVLPVGISFYTFQSLSYTFDIYRKQLKPTSRFSDFALFVGYFPQLQAGPIERARHLLPQLANPRHPTLAQTSRGLYLIALGFFKKVAIADGVAPVVNQIFSSTGLVTWIDVVVGTVLFAVQIYCDFSGYTDIARGISKKRAPSVEKVRRHAMSPSHRGDRIPPARSSSR